MRLLLDIGNYSYSIHITIHILCVLRINLWFEQNFFAYNPECALISLCLCEYETIETNETKNRDKVFALKVFPKSSPMISGLGALWERFGF